MAHLKRQLYLVLIIILVISSVYECSVRYRVLNQDPNKTEAGIYIIKEPSIYWTIVLRFDNKVRLKVNSGGNIIISSPEGKLYQIAGNPGGPGQNQTLVFTSKYDKKPGAKLISANFNGRPIRLT